MKKEVTKFVIAPIDGSRMSLRSLDYILRIYGVEHHFKIALMYILPALPPVMVEESKRNRNTAKQLKIIEEKNIELGHRILEEAQGYLIQKGFQPDAVQKICEKKRSGIARDINACVEERLADALVVSSSGKGWLEGFLMGEVTNKLIEIIRICPVWVIKGDVRSANVLLAVDGSENSLRAIDHVLWMLSETHGNIVLFHTKRSLNRFFPKEVFEGVGEIESTWFREAGKAIEPGMMKARDRLIQAGFDPSRIEIKIVNGSRRPDKDILRQAIASNAGTIVMGRRGATDVREYTMGSITRKVLNEADDMAVWIVS